MKKRNVDEQVQRWIQDLLLGGGAHIKKIAPSGGRREHFWGISYEKSRFYAKKSWGPTEIHGPLLGSPV
jgi:hypothetical protein